MNTVDRTYSRARDEKGWEMVELHLGSSFSWKVSSARCWVDDTTRAKGLRQSMHANQWIAVSILMDWLSQPAG